MSLSNAISDVKDAIGSFFDSIFNFSDNVSDGTAGLFKSIGVQPGEETTSAVQKIADEKQLSDKETQDVVDYNNSGDVDAAADILEPNSSLTRKEIILLLNNLQDTVAGTIVIEPEEYIITDVYEVGSDSKAENGKDYTYKQIGTVEELEAEFASIKRPVTEIVIHWTESYENANLTAEQINERFEKLGGQIPYHYIIQRNGVLQRGAKIENATDHSRHSTNTIAIALVGGYNTSTQDKDFAFNTGIRSFTRVQFNTLDEVLRVFYNRYPGGQVLGHNDIDENHQDPGFDVIEYCYNKFGRVSKFQNPFEESAMDAATINQKEPEGFDIFETIVED